MQKDQLRALLAIIDHGTFEAAARSLHLTPSAISQRIRALETSVGRLVVRRAVPCEPTDAGEVLIRMARQQQVLEADAWEELGVEPGAVGELSIAVNADSLATWFTPVLDAVASWDDTALRLHVEDQDHSSHLLRSGAVLGAVTSDPVVVQGCEIRALGSMRYLPMATPSVRERFAHGRGVDWSRMPMVRFNAKDDIQHQMLAARAVTTEPPTHYVPSSQGFIAAVRAGLGWGMVPIDQLGGDLESGRLVLLAARTHIDVPLYWQVWRLKSARIDRISRAVSDAARDGLRYTPAG